MKKPRILLYSHNGFGMGHFGRNTAIAKALKQSIPNANIIVASGGTLNQWTYSMMPPNVEFVKVPSMRTKSVASLLKPNKLNLAIEDVVTIRSHMIKSLVETFKPHIFIVDHSPTGVWHELEITLKYLKHHKSSNCAILGFRGFDGAYHSLNGFPESHREKMKKLFFFINKYYDAIFSYSAEEFINNQYALPQSWILNDFKKKMIYTGYISAINKHELPSRFALRNRYNINNKKLIVVAGGGSPDSDDLLMSYLSVLKILPKDSVSYIFPPVFLSDSQKRYLLNKIKYMHNVFIKESSNNQRQLFSGFLKASDVFIGRAGYNTISDALHLCRSAILVPRAIKQEVEQYIHARILAQHELVQMIESYPINNNELIKKIQDALSEKFVPAYNRYAKYFYGNEHIVGFVKKTLNKLFQ